MLFFNPDSDPIIGRIHQIAFSNGVNDNVNVIYVPSYLNGADGIFNMDYYDVLIGVDATIFPSYYEPWGYTPLESVAFGVPTITTTLSGFGQWILSEKINGFLQSGVDVVHRGDYNYDQASTQIAEQIVRLQDESSDNMLKIRQSAKKLHLKPNGQILSAIMKKPLVARWNMPHRGWNWNNNQKLSIYLQDLKTTIYSNL